MAIILKIQPYCANCLDFEASVTKADKVIYGDGTFVLNDTIVRCEYARRCENIRKFLAKQDKDVVKEEI